MSDSNHSNDIGTIAYLHGVESGKAYERAKIVAWLRDGVAMSDFYLNHVEAREIAQYIEAGDHLK